MQAVIIASDPAFELRPLTFHVPKSLIRVGDRCVIEHASNSLPDEIKEVIIVIGHLGEQVKNFCGKKINQRRVTYIKQKNFSGSARALHLCKDILASRFLVLPSDGIFPRDDITKCMKFDQCVLAKEVSGKFTGERITLDGDGFLKDIIPGVHDKNKTLVNTGFYVMTRAFFNFKLVPSGGSKRYDISLTLASMAKSFPVNVERSQSWLPLTDLAGIKRAEKAIKKGRKIEKAKREW